MRICYAKGTLTILINGETTTIYNGSMTTIYPASEGVISRHQIGHQKEA